MGSVLRVVAATRGAYRRWLCVYAERWSALHNLPRMIQNFTEWGVPFPQFMTPLVSGIEFVGGLLLILDLLKRLWRGLQDAMPAGSQMRT